MVFEDKVVPGTFVIIRALRVDLVLLINTFFYFFYYFSHFYFARMMLIQVLLFIAHQLIFLFFSHQDINTFPPPPPTLDATFIFIIVFISSYFRSVWHPFSCFIVRIVYFVLFCVTFSLGPTGYTFPSCSSYTVNTFFSSKFLHPEFGSQCCKYTLTEPPAPKMHVGFCLLLSLRVDLVSYCWL